MKEKGKAPPQLTPFKPGQSGNPSGRPALTKDEKRQRRLTREKFKEATDMLLSHTIGEIREKLNDPNTNAMIYKICEALIKESYLSTDRILDRSIGKVKEDLQVQLAVPTIIKYRSGEIEEYGSKLIDGEEDDD